jgi:hypothetical protein
MLIPKTRPGTSCPSLERKLQSGTSNHEEKEPAALIHGQETMVVRSLAAGVNGRGRSMTQVSSSSSVVTQWA